MLMVMNQGCFMADIGDMMNLAYIYLHKQIVNSTKCTKFIARRRAFVWLVNSPRITHPQVLRLNTWPTRVHTPASLHVVMF
jgi:hypothetical protein